ncbi:MAG: hypothetical protein J0H64_00710, partial [Actinobacteria bacterium]|nr:hypothetical protein [Actinomycetota bacterium]
LLEGLSRSTSTGTARVRLLCGTGMLGGFTTYSSLALAVAALLHDGQGWIALGYGLGTLLLGALTTYFGILLGTTLRRRRDRSDRSDRSGGEHHGGSDRRDGRSAAQSGSEHA